MKFFEGINLQGLVQMAADSRLMEAEYKQQTVHALTRHLEDEFHLQQLHDKPPKSSVISDCFQAVPRCLNVGLRCGCYIVVLYISVKLLYVLNIICQFAMLNHFLGTQSALYGFHVLSDLVNGIEWEQTGIFPRVTLCDFEVRVLGNIHRHTVNSQNKNFLF